MFSTGFTSLYFSLYWSPSSSLCSVFYSISSNINEFLSINPSANVLIFGNFNIHHKDWLNYSGETDRPGEPCYNFSISNELNQMVNFPTWIPVCDCHSPALFDSFLSFGAGTCSTVAYSPLGNSDYAVVSVSRLSTKLTTGCPVSLHSLWLFSCWMGQSSWSFERCSMGRSL